eukprot:XP_015574107.1 uncharacterized protein LOC8265626 [Ricinus communis]
MEEMDTEQVVEIPDTPDRITARRINDLHLGKESNSYAAGPSRTSDLSSKESLNQLRARGRLVSENGFSRSLHLNPGRIPVKTDELEPRNRSIAFSPLRNSHPSRNAPLFRRGAVTNNSKTETQHSIRMQQLGKGKAEFANIPSKLPVLINDEVLFDMAFPRGASKALHAKETRDVQVSSNSGSSSHFAPEIPSNLFKGKEKVDVNACNGSDSALNHGKGIDLTGSSPHKIEKQASASHLSVTSPRVTGHKRLVRNGCISPHNIATRQQKLAESRQDCSIDVGTDDSKNIVSDGPSEVDIREIIVGEKNEENNHYRAKGKGLVTYPSTSTENDAQIFHVSTSSRIENKAANVTSDTSRDASLGGWRSTRNHAKKLYHADDEFSADEQHENRVARRNTGTANVKNVHESGDRVQAQTASRHVSGLNQTNRPHHIGNIHTKRQKKYGLTSRNDGEYSTTVPDDSEIMLLGSSDESSRSRSSRTSYRQRRGILHPIYEVDESLPERRTGSSQGLSSENDIEADARARQVEADEMLARELQEQLYQETPASGGSEIDEDAAWLLQQVEDVFPTASSQSYPISRLRRPATMHSNTQPQPRSFQNPSNRRGTQSRLPATRTSQLRNRLFNRPPARLLRARNHSLTSSSTTRNFQFPLSMDLEMRLDILEALEDMSVTNSHILQVQRDFNENDYEMLLALDENNQQHGASTNRINSLPESVLQTDNFEETCAICLETPTIGETIRHLPCLHKFHKDCIDPWLSRRTSCPVCKSSIT